MSKKIFQYCHNLISFMWRRKLVLTCIFLVVLSFIFLTRYSSYSHRKTPMDIDQATNIDSYSNHDSPSEYRILRPQNPFHMSKKNSKNKLFIPSHRLVHLDFKGAPPKVAFFENFFPLLKTAGATGVLLEYEDMFPYAGDLKEIKAKNSFTIKDIKHIHFLARRHDFEIIPLVQVFGHLEFVLKLQNFSHLRESFAFPQALCPLKDDSFILATKIIDQVLALHPKSKWVHIGGDEVFHIGLCSQCKKHKRSKLYLSYISKVAKYIRDKHQKIPIIWDDMLRNFSKEELKSYKFGDLVEPMVWSYVKDISNHVTETHWRMYANVFPYVWTASAFKGAFGGTSTAPNVKMHLENNIAWLNTMQSLEHNFTSIRGITTTGWQRYDHFGTLCELLPAAIPSLILNLLTLSQGFFSSSLFNKLQRLLQCTTSSYQSLDLEKDPYLWKLSMLCFYQGSSTLRLTYRHNQTIKEIDDYIYDKTIHKAWMTAYNLRHNLTSPMRVDEALQDHSSNIYSINALIRAAKDALREVYDEYTVSEWIEQNIYPYLLKMEKLSDDAASLKKARIWSKRPLPPLKALEKYSVGFKFINKNR